MIADEIQSGLARTGKMLACDWEEVRPDVVVRAVYLFFVMMIFLTTEHGNSIFSVLSKILNLYSGSSWYLYNSIGKNSSL